MADALRMTGLDGFANMRAQSVRRQLTGSKFAGVLGEMHVGMQVVEVIEDPHVQAVIVHRCIAVFRHYGIQRYKPRVGLNYGEAGHNLGKHLLPRRATIDLVDVSNRYVTTRVGMSDVLAGKQPVFLGLRIVQNLQDTCDSTLDSGSIELLALFIEVVGPARFGTDLAGVPVESDGHFQIGFVLMSRPRCHLGQRFSGMRICY